MDNMVNMDLGPKKYVCYSQKFILTKFIVIKFYCKHNSIPQNITWLMNLKCKKAI